MKDKLYLWKLDKSGAILQFDLEKVPKSVYKYRIRSTGKYKYFYEDDLDMFKHDRVVSESGDKEYIKKIITKGLFKKMLKAQEAYNIANDKYIKFREVNR